jgi:long-chain acyl-CoA synthetase
MGGSDGSQDRTLLDALSRHLANRPTAPAYRTGDAILTFAAIESLSNKIANALAAMGIKAGDRVACLTKHHTECILLTIAALKVGAVCMPVNWRLAPDEVSFIVADGQCRFLMVDTAFMSQFVGDRPIKSGLEKIVCTESQSEAAPAFADWYASHSDKFGAIAAEPDDAALQLYSSGTTGLPKGIVLSHRGLLSTSRVVSREWAFGSEDVLGNPLPTFHVAGMTMLLLTLYTGGTTTAYSEFNAESFIENVGRHGITHAFLVPAMLLFMLDSPAAEQGDYRTLKLIAYGGSPISERVMRDAMRVFGCDFLQVYGLTEVSGPATFLFPSDHRTDGSNTEILRSAGKPIGGARIRIVDPVTLKDLPEGQTGEIWIESDRNLKEYWRNPEATRQAYPEGRNERGGWLRTGDSAYMKDGYIYINDRIKDMIISGGENIYPAEIENVLMTHPSVFDCAIIGVPDLVWGEAVKGCVVLKPGVAASAQEIIAWLRGRIAHYKCPKSVDFVEELPRNPSGKVLKRILREPFWKGRERAVN